MSQYIVVSYEEAYQLLPDLSIPPDCWVLLLEQDGQYTYQANDAMEPEDALLVRDLDWVPRLLNQQLAEIERLRSLLADNQTGGSGGCDE